MRPRCCAGCGSSEPLLRSGRTDRLWCMDVTEHPTGDGKLYLAVVLDAFSRMVVGWSIADHMRAELVVDALQMAIWRRQPPPGVIAHSDHGAQYTSWAFGHRLRAAGLLGSMGSVGDATTTVSSKASSGRCSSSCSTNTAGTPASSSRSRSSSGSKRGTTRVAVTPTAACSAPPTTRPLITPARSKVPHDGDRRAKPSSQLPSEARDRRGWYQQCRRSSLCDRRANPTPELSAGAGEAQSTRSGWEASRFRSQDCHRAWRSPANCLRVYSWWAAFSSSCARTSRRS